VSFGDPDGEDFAVHQVRRRRILQSSGLPDGDWRITVFDQWNDTLVDGLQRRQLSGGTVNMGQMHEPVAANIYTKSFIDLNHDGIQDNDATAREPWPYAGSDQHPFGDGSFSNFNNTDWPATRLNESSRCQLVCR